MANDQDKATERPLAVGNTDGPNYKGDLPKGTLFIDHAGPELGNDVVAIIFPQAPAAGEPIPAKAFDRAAMFVRAVNAHDDLVDVCERLIAHVEKLDRIYGDDLRESCGTIEIALQAREALAKAKP